MMEASRLAVERNLVCDTRIG